MNIPAKRLLAAAVAAAVLGPASLALPQAGPGGDFETAERLLNGLLAKAPNVHGLHLQADPNVVVLLDSDASGPRIRMNPSVLRTVYSRYPGEKGDRVVTVMFARFIGQIQAGQPVGGEVLYTLDQVDVASCRAVRLLGKEWYRRYLVEVFARDEGEASDQVERLLSKCD